MGVKDLYAWTKLHHKHLITEVRRRFKDPRVQGKKIAIDATLLTNAFHMRRVEANEVGKQALIGWYTMIREMRAAGVQPIAVWDQRGTRAWKAAEARRRLSIRALALARRNHEDERKLRLDELREALDEYSAKPEKEQEALRAIWERKESTVVTPPEVTPPEVTSPQITIPEIAPPESASPQVALNVRAAREPGVAQEVQVTSEVEAATGATPSVPLDQAFAAKVAALIERHRQFDQRDRRRKLEEELKPVVDQMRELEVDMGETTEPGAFDEMPAEEGAKKAEKGVTAIDETLQYMLPPDVWAETPRQKDLTTLEGKIIDSLMGKPVKIDDDPDESTTDEMPEGATVETAPRGAVPIEAVQAELNDLMLRLPEVRYTYAKSLALPSAADHQDCRDLLVKLGVPIVTAMIPYEAEGLASAMARAGIVDYVGTEDSDVIAYEGPLLRHIGTRRPLAFVSGASVRESSGMTSEQFLDFCVLLGTDASPRIHKVGPMTAAKLIMQHGSIENILAREPKIAEKAPEGYMDMVASAREVFMNLPPLPEDVSLEQGVWDEDDVATWLGIEHGIRFVEDEGELSVELANGFGAMPGRSGYWEIDRDEDDEEMDDNPDWARIVREAWTEMQAQGRGQGQVGQVGQSAEVLELDETDEPDDVENGEEPIESMSGTAQIGAWQEVVEAEMSQPGRAQAH